MTGLGKGVGVCRFLVFGFFVMNLKFHSVLDDVDDAWPGRRAGVLILWGSPFRSKATPGPEGAPLPWNDVVELPPASLDVNAIGASNAKPNSASPATVSITGRLPAPAALAGASTPHPENASGSTPALPAPSASLSSIHAENQSAPSPNQLSNASSNTSSPIEIVPETHPDPALDVRPYGEEPVSFFVKHWLENRPKSDSIVISGEEPLQQGVALVELCKELKDEGFEIKLDTRGFYPEKLSDLLPYVDYVSMEIPTRLESNVYAAALRFDGDKDIPVSNALRSLVFLENWAEPGIREAKTIVVPHRNASPADIVSISETISASVDQYALQSYDPVLSLISPPVGQPMDPAALAELARIAKEKVKKVLVRTPGKETVV